MAEELSTAVAEQVNLPAEPQPDLPPEPREDRFTFSIDYIEPPQEKGFFDVIGRAFERENLLTRGLIHNYESSKQFPIDLDYNYYEHKDELTADLPQEYHSEVANADSLKEAQNIKFRISDELQGQRELEQAGWAGISAQLVAGVFSLENLVPLGATMNWANKGGRLATAAKSGLVAGASAGASEAALASMEYTKDGEDILYAATFGMVLGGGMGGILAKGAPRVNANPTVVKAANDLSPTVDAPVRTPQAFGPPKPEIVTTKVERDIQRREGPVDADTHIKVNALYDNIRNLDLSRASQKVRKSIADAFVEIDHRAPLDTETAAKLDEIYTELGYTPKETEIITNRVSGSFRQLEEDMAYASQVLRDDMDVKLADDAMYDDAGAMRNREIEEQFAETSLREDDIKDTADDWATDNDVSQKLTESRTNRAAQKMGILASDYTQLVNHPSNIVKKIGFDLLEGGVGTLGRTRTASMFKDMYERRLLSKGLIPLNEQYSIWAKSQNLGFFKREFFVDGYDKYYNEVRSVLEGRTQGIDVPAHPAVIEAADRWDDMMQEALSIGQKSGWEAMQGIKPRKGYVPLVWQGQRMMKHAPQKVTQLIAKGYRSVGVDDETANVIASAVYKRAIDGTAGVDANIAGLLDKSQRDQLAAVLQGVGLSDKEISSLVKRLDAREAQSGPGFTKGRTNIDLTVSENGLSLLDLVDNDLNSLASRYSRDVAGRSALAKKGIINEGHWRAMKSAALKDNETLKVGDGHELSQHLDDVKSYFTASPIAGGVSPGARRVQQSATLSMLGMVGVPQLAEVGTVVGRYGLRAAGKHIPAAEEVFTLAKTRSNSGDFLDELRPLIGDFDYDHLLYRPDIQIDDSASTNATWLKVLDRGLGAGNTMLGYASGMNSVRHMEHRLAMRTVVDKIAGIATGRTTDSAARLADIGLDPKTLESVTKQINKHAVFTDEGSLKELGLSKWPNEVAEDFVMAANRHTAQVVQRQLAGETSAWMHKTIGSLLTQFRHFPIVAFEKQLLRNLRHKDQALATTMLYGFAVSYGIQMGRAGLEGKDLDDQETILKKTVNYMGMASIAPDVLTVASQLGLAPDSLNFRKLGHTGSHADEFDIIDHIPAAGQVNKMVRAAALPVKAASGDATSADVRAGVAAMPFGNTIFSKLMFEAMLED